MHGLRVVAIAAALLFTFSSHPVLAQEAPTGEETRALELFDSAAQKFREGRFREAIELLDEAYRLKPSAILRYNKARAYEGLGDESRAIVEYEAYLEMAPDARDRGAVERRLATLRAGIAERERLERERRLAAQRVRSEPAPAPKRRPSPVPWIVAGVGLVGLGVGTFFAVRAFSEEQDGNDAANQKEADDHKARAETAATGSNIAFVAGGALFVGGTIWGVIDL